MIRDFDHVFRSKEGLWEFVRQSLEENCPLIIDDKAYSYVLYGITKQAMLIADPHLIDRSKRKCLMPLHKLFSKSWMLLRKRDAHKENV